MEAVSTSETSVNFNEITRRNIPEDRHLHTNRRENLKSHIGYFVCLHGRLAVQVLEWNYDLHVGCIEFSITDYVFYHSQICYLNSHIFF
jgi:hypothetical protein